MNRGLDTASPAVSLTVPYRTESASMNTTLARTVLLGATAALVASCAWLPQEMRGMSFFVTSANPGKGADFGGLAGADQHCQSLAAAAGAGGKTRRAYLSAA